jgi:hypothetical protein
LEIGNARAGIAYGTLNNFDCVNDTGVQAHGFDIEMDDIQSKDITLHVRLQSLRRPQDHRGYRFGSGPYERPYSLLSSENQRRVVGLHSSALRPHLAYRRPPVHRPHGQLWWRAFRGRLLRRPFGCEVLLVD